MKIKTVLCPTDFSTSSEAALAFATDLAKRLGARIHLLHVFQLPYYVGWEDGLAMASATAEMLDRLRSESELQLKSRADACAKAGIEADFEQDEGAPYAKIVERSQSADLVVMGTHGRTGLPRLLLGSVAERVVRLSHCPVITVPTHEPAER